MSRKRHKRGQIFSPGEIVELVRVTYRKYGEPLTFHRFCHQAGVPGWQVYRHFRSWLDLRLAAGLPEMPPSSRRISENHMLDAFHQATMELRRYPTPAEFEQFSRMSYQLLRRRIGTWTAVKQHYKEWLEREWTRAGPAERALRGLNCQAPSDRSAT